jgi:hypothetical protein
MSKMEAKIDANDVRNELEIHGIDYDPTGNPNSTRAIELAEREGLDVKFPADNELFIDIDNEHSFKLFQNQFYIVKHYIGVVKTKAYPYDYVVTPSRHGLPGRHIVVTLSRNVTKLERIALQACLGSDRVREVLGFVQIQNGDPHPTLFLEAKAPAQKLLTEGV